MWSFSFHREVWYHPVMKTLLLSLSVLPMGIFLSSEVNVIFIGVWSQWCFFPVLRKWVIIDDSIQLSPEGEVNSGGYIQRREASRYISIALHRSEGDSCFSIYQIRWIKKCCFNFFFWTFAKRRAIFLFVRKTVNSQGYSELREPIKTRENCYPLIW